VTKGHAALISLLLGIAVVLGMLATTRTTGLAQGTTVASPATLLAREDRLDRLQAQIREARTSRPPALPSLPAASTSAAPRVRYVRPAPVVLTSGAAGQHEDEHEDEDEWDEESDD
jgi:hypothetical protein